MRGRIVGGPFAPPPTCYFLNSFFYNFLFMDAQKYSYGKVAKWTKVGTS